ncbi:MAG: hypothetical protein HWE27_09190 [Gammaproteobacteria bacterium]|nr:hypothetical protein [Gammaproteobacteria bacterium]
MKVIIMLIVATTLLLGCGPSSRVQLPITYKASHSSSLNKICPVKFDVLDVRKNKQSLGNYGGLSVNADSSVEQWIENGIEKYFEGTVKINNSLSKSTGWKILLKKSYITTLATKFSSNIVLSLENQQQNYKRLFRGNNVRTNWSGGRSEMIDSLNLALVDSLRVMNKELDSICMKSSATQVVFN